MPDADGGHFGGGGGEGDTTKTKIISKCRFCPMEFVKNEKPRGDDKNRWTADKEEENTFGNIYPRPAAGSFDWPTTR